MLSQHEMKLGQGRVAAHLESAPDERADASQDAPIFSTLLLIPLYGREKRFFQHLQAFPIPALHHKPKPH
jgi:hypothetical protein